jgi:hypothetical protein
MKRKILGIFICTLLIATAIQSVIAIHLSTTPNDPDFTEQWYLDNTGQTGGTSDADIDALEAWEIETGNQDIVVAIIDSGIDYTHPDLVNKIWTNEDEIPDNGIDDDNNGYIDDYHGYDFKNNDADMLDEHGHGTVIAGVIGAETNNDIGIAGICWDCKIMPLKYWNTDSRNEIYIDRIGNILEAVEYAVDNGADVISMSYGTTEEWFTQEEYNLANDTLNYAISKGCVLVSIAGNENGSDPFYPGAFENVICVAGTDHNDNRMDYQYPPHGQIVISNYGEWVDVAAPGEEIYTTSPTYDCVITDLGREHDYTLMSGTSLAVPHVSGLAALLLSRDSTLTPEEVKTLICENVDPYDSEYDLGSGRINAYKALSALNTPPNTPDIDGSTSGKAREEQEFIISATDPHEDDISYCIDWGDDSGEVTIGPFPSGQEQTVTYTWSEKGDYTIRVKAQDILGAESDWTELDINMPKSKTTEIKNNNEIDSMMFCDVLIKGSATVQFIRGSFILGFGKCFYMKVELENDGTLEISSITNPSNSVELEGSHQIHLIGFVGFYSHLIKTRIDGKVLLAIWG